MDYKEKYEQAISRMNKWVEGSEIMDPKEVAEFVFPELKESNDERIRKELLNAIQETEDSLYMVLTPQKRKSFIAWLEKQGEKKSKKVSLWKHWKDGIAGNGEGKLTYLIKIGNTYNLTSCLGFECDYIELSELDGLTLEKPGEQKPTDKVESTFKVGDWIYHEISGNTCHINKIENGLYVSDEGATISLGRQNDWRLWTIQDAKDGDVLCIHSSESDSDCVFLYQNTYEIEPNRNVAVAYCCIDIYENKIEFGIQGPDCIDVRNVTPATKEQRDLLFQKMKEAGYEWDAEKKELKKIEQEEDDKLTDFESALFSAFSYAWQEYLIGREVNVAKWAREHSAELLEVARKPKFCHHEVDFSGCSEEYRKAYYDGWNNCNQQHSQLKAEQKPAWSGEDENIFNDIIMCLDGNFKSDKSMINWLKCLKERIKG